MQIFEGSRTLGERARGCVLTVGNFDGLHRGHQALLGAVLERARALGQPAAVYTFDPHPRAVLAPETSPPQLMTWAQLVDGFERAGIDLLIREAFTADFASLSPESFLRDVIAERVDPAEIFVGRDFHFGKGRAGTGDTLASLAPRLEIRVGILPQVRAGEDDVSSTRVREALGAGDVEDAELCLGRPYTIWGRVVEGDRRGRTLGFPTANLDPENELIPANGVYATAVRLFEGDKLSDVAHPSVTNVGTRPTFEAGRVLAEAHLIDFDGDLYGRRIALSFCRRIRAEERFPGADALKRQIALDVERARELLSGDGA